MVCGEDIGAFCGKISHLRGNFFELGFPILAIMLVGESDKFDASPSLW